MNIKKIGKILLVLMLVAIYANIGYWLGTEKYYSNNSTGPNVVQSFLQGPNKIFYLPKWDFKIAVTRIIYMILWPFILGGVFLFWLGYFLFFGGLFKTIGLIPSILAGIFLLLIARRIHVRKKTG